MKRRNREEDSQQKGGSGALMEAPPEGTKAAEDGDDVGEGWRRRPGSRGESQRLAGGRGDAGRCS